jgi:predicted transcriptional regulator
MKKGIHGFRTKMIVRVDEELLKRLEDFTERKKWKKSFVIREAVKEYLDRHEDE